MRKQFVIFRNPTALPPHIEKSSEQVSVEYFSNENGFDEEMRGQIENLRVGGMRWRIGIKDKTGFDVGVIRIFDTTE